MMIGAMRKTIVKTMTFKELATNNRLAVLWIETVHHPFIRIKDNQNTDCLEDYCDLNDLVQESQFESFSNLEGTIEDGRWIWNGQGTPSYLSNSVLQIMAFT